MLSVISRVPAWGWSCAAIAAALVFAALGRAGIFPPPYGLVLAVIASTGFAILGWVRLDEPAREAHKFAWWWGGASGMAAAVIACAALPFIAGAPDQIAELLQSRYRGGPPQAVAFVTGVLAAALAQLAGYAIVWAGWWLAKR